MRARGFLFFALVWGLPALANRFHLCFQSVFTLRKPEQKTPVEIEVPASDELVATFKTTDGTTGPVLAKVAPPWFLRKLAKQHGTTPSKLPWELVGVPERRKLFVWVAKKRGVTFDEDRTIPGIVMPRHVLVNWESREGDLYRSGVIPRAAEWGKVEFMSEKSMLGAVHKVELHLLARKPSGDVVQRAWDLIEKSYLGIAKPHFHAHILRPIAEVLPLGAKPVRIAQVMDFRRRAEMAAQMLCVFENKPVRLREANGVYLWGPMNVERMHDLAEWLTRIAKGSKFTDKEQQLYKSLFKRGLIGLRGPATYEGDVPMLGLEPRGILNPLRPERTPNYEENMRQFLNGLQGAYEDDNFGMAPEHFQKWFEANSLDLSIPLRMTRNYHVRSQFGLYEAAAPELRALLFNNDDAWWRFAELLKDDESYKLLLHNWTDDPLFFDQPELLEKIHQAQIKAMKSALRSTTPQGAKRALKDFLLESEVFERFLGSVGVEIVPPAVN